MSTLNSANHSVSLWRNMVYMLTSEVSIRITRLATAVILARMLSAHEFGVIAIAMTLQEIVQTLTRNGIGAKIIQTTDSKLHSVCNTVYRLNWQICLTLFALQCALAQPLAVFYQDDSIFFLVLVLAIPYLIYPWALVHVYLIQRDNRLNITAFANGSQVSLDNLLSAALALSGFGIWSVIIPKVIVAPCWVIYYRHIQNWHPDNKTYPQETKQIISFSGQVLGAEICATSRRHIDRLLIGYFFGLDILGIYYFAINAGLGLTLSLSTAFNTAFYPHLCSLKNNTRVFQQAFKKGLLLIIGLSVVVFSSQAFLASWYVPLIFGEKWQHAIPLLVILTLSGILRPAAETCAQMLRAINKPSIDFKWNLVFTLCLSLSIYAAVYSKQIETVGYAILLAHTLLIPIYLLGCWFLSAKNSKKQSSPYKASKTTHGHLLEQAYPYLKNLVSETADPKLLSLISQIETMQSNTKLPKQEV